MMLISVILLIFGLIDHVSSIECFTCHESDFYCTLPLNLDGGDESNENTVSSANYDPSFACQIERTFNPNTDEEKLILRGIAHCDDLDVPNHRIACCYTSNCNKIMPRMDIRTSADLSPIKTKEVDSNAQHYVSSIVLIAMTILVQFFY